MKSLQYKINKISNLKEGDTNPWEKDFIKNIKSKVEKDNGLTENLSDKQIDIIEKIYSKNF